MKGLTEIEARAPGRMRQVPLTCHPDTRCVSVREVRAGAQRAADGTLQVAFSVAGHFNALSIPAPREPCVARELWRHTCFEAFVGVEGSSAYHEYNLSPSGEWALYAFRGYRDGDLVSDDRLAPQIRRREDSNLFELRAAMPLGSLSTAYRVATLDVGLSAVIEGIDGTLSYWALRHPGPKPDFHHIGARLVRLAGTP